MTLPPFVLHGDENILMWGSTPIILPPDRVYTHRPTSQTIDYIQVLTIPCVHLQFPCMSSSSSTETGHNDFLGFSIVTNHEPCRHRIRYSEFPNLTRSSRIRILCCLLSLQRLLTNEYVSWRGCIVTCYRWVVWLITRRGADWIPDLFAMEITTTNGYNY
jgi:hypothetical protein